MPHSKAKASSEVDEPLAPYLPQTALGLMAPVAPPLKWAGGKGQLLPQMQRYFPPRIHHYHEPFLGGGAVFFHLAPQHGVQAFLSDRNEELINFYRVLRDQTEPLLERLRTLEAEYLQSTPDEQKQMYYRWRNADRQPDFHRWSSLDRAVRFYFLNKTAFNGLYRTNRRGEFNVPWGHYPRPSLYRPELLRNAAEVLQRFAYWLEAAPFEVVLEQVKPGDFVYLDPPYAPLSPTANFTAYTKEDFGPHDQRRLAQLCRELDRRGVMFLLSNSDLPWVRELYAGFEMATVQARRNINRNGKGRGPIAELLVRNYGGHDESLTRPTVENDLPARED